MLDYKGIKIYDKVIIVERTSTTEGKYNYKGKTVNQGYVVDVGNKKMLENALNWAKWTKYDESLRPSSYGSDFKQAWDTYHNSAQTIPGVVHEYTNGQFEITLDEAAGWSSQGGKLSFWNCLIKAPDNKMFLIGINSELLLHLMMCTTLTKGVCNSKVWLGRIKGTQVGVFTSEMEDFKQAKKDEETRNTVKSGTKVYKPGDIVYSIQEEDTYYGEVKELFSVYRYWSWGYYTNDKYFIVFNSQPKIKHLYKSKEGWDSLKDNRVKRVIKGHVDLTETAYDYIKQKLEKEIKDLNKPDSNFKFDLYEKIGLLQYVDLNTVPDTLETIKNKILEYLTYWRSQENSGVNRSNYYFVKDTELDTILAQQNIKKDLLQEKSIF